MPSAGRASGPLVVILGPTAVGKTALSIALAQALQGEIVSADSRLVYKGMNIGVAKPSPGEQALVPHHLLDLIRPDEWLSLAVYQQMAYQAIDGILERTRLPLLVGGTGQYISAVIEGWGIPEVPPNPALREELEHTAAAYGPQALHDRLRQHDPVSADRIHPHNVRRVIRALEVFLQSGQPISELQRKKPPPYHVLQMRLICPRAELYRRIDERLDHMMRNGLLDEVRGLLAAGYDRKLPAMSGLGYAQLSSYLHNEVSLEDALQAIRRETHAFARRQETWFRKYNRDAQGFTMAENTASIMIERVRQWLESKDHAPSEKTDRGNQ